MRRLLLRLLLGGVTVYALVLLLAWRFQERLAFPGARGSLPTPREAGFAGGERIELADTDGARVTGWYLAPEDTGWGSPAPGLLWFHGNRENIEDIAPIIRELRPPGLALVVVDYRGYGESRGRITEDAMYEDGAAAWDDLARRPEVDATRIAVYGRSIGSAVALEVATSHPAAAVVLDSPFTTADAMARRHYPIFPRALRRMRLDNLDRATQLTAPLLVIHGADDYIAPVEMGMAVARAGRADEVVVFENAGHNDTYSRNVVMYRARLWAFLERTVGRPPGGSSLTDTCRSDAVGRDPHC